MTLARMIFRTKFGKAGEVVKMLKHPFRNLLTCFVLIGLLTACKPITRPPSGGGEGDAREIPPITAVKIPTFSDSVQQEVMEAEQEFNYAADFLHDVPTSQRMLADDYQDSDGNNKERKLAGIEYGFYRGTSADFTEVEIVVDGDTATISFVLTGTGYRVGQSESTVTGMSTCTDTWMKRNGQWQLVTAKC